MVLKDLPQFPLCGYGPQFVDRGANGGIYRVRDDLVAKISFADTTERRLRILEKEAKFNHLMFDLGISVPRPDGLFSLKLADFLGQCFPAMVMEYIAGIHPRWDIDDPVWLRAAGLKQAEFTKVRTLGVEPFEADWLYQPEPERVVLLDYDKWVVQDTEAGRKIERALQVIDVRGRNPQFSI